MPQSESHASPSFGQVVARAVSRRTVLAGSASAALLSLFGCASTTGTGKGARPPSAKIGADANLMQFNPVTLREAATPNGRSWPLVSRDYEFDLILPWGDPINPTGPKFRWPPNAVDQAVQIGTGHDGMWFFPSSDSPNSKGVLAINHEFGSTATILGKSLPQSLEEVRVSQHAHGVSILNIERVDGRWKSVGGDNVRRVHVNTPVTFSGPAANHALLANRSDDVPKGTLNNCAFGHTPWGTYLTCEENWAFYFGTTRSGFSPTIEQQRYSLFGRSFYGWHNFDPRFNLQSEDYANESHRFGWIVEIDPHDANQVPVKHTALGRFGHEGATVAVGKDDRVVVYLGDDSGHEHIYKFVSSASYQKLLSEGKSPLAHGQLYAAKFNEDQTGEWIPLSLDNPALAERFKDDAEIVTYVRIAAKIVGATPMDRPEWITIGPNGEAYCTLTNNSRRTVPNAANPMAPNTHGHIVRWTDSDHHVGLTFTWDIFLMAKDTQNTEELFDSPDGLWADSEGRLFIETDGNQSDSDTSINNQLLVADTNTGEIRRLFTGVNDCEITGLAVTPDQRTMFVNIQHPGVSNFRPGEEGRIFPALGETTSVPRDCTVVLEKKDGGVVGS